jgi:tetrapyrrole methylase family protein/MazG family protein
MTGTEHLQEVVRRLRGEDGCPWDRRQTHESLKPEIIEEAAEVLGGISIYTETGSAENLKEELGDLLLQVVMQSQIAEEEGLFTLDDVAETAAQKMIRRHPHVFSGAPIPKEGEEKAMWEKIKKQEKAGREWEASYLPGAFQEAETLIQRAEARKGFNQDSGKKAGGELSGI